MNQQKLTQRDLETNTRQMLLLVLFTLFLAVPGFAQVTNSEAKYVENPYTARALNDLFTRPGLTETTNGSSGGTTNQPASPSGRFAVFVGAGVTVPHGDFSTFVDPGFSLNTGLEYMITSQFSAEGTLGYHRFSTFFDEHIDLYQVSGNGKFYFIDESSNVRPFVNGGVGVYVTNSATTHFGGNVGGGILYEVTPKFGLQGSYNFHAFTAGSGTRYSTVQGGIRFRF